MSGPCRLLRAAAPLLASLCLVSCLLAPEPPSDEGEAADPAATTTTLEILDPAGAGTLSLDGSPLSFGASSYSCTISSCSNGFKRHEISFAPSEGHRFSSFELREGGLCTYARANPLVVELSKTSVSVRVVAEGQ